MANDIYAVIDTNVIVSAMISKRRDTAPVLLWNYYIMRPVGKAIIPVYNNEIIDEYENVLRRPKFRLDDWLVDEVLETIRRVGIHADRLVSDEAFPDPKDIVFYEVTLSVEDAYLITGNIKHFPKKPFVLTPAQMLDLLAQ